MHEKNNTTLSASSGVPGGDPENRDKPESRRNSGKDSKNSNEYEMNARQSKRSKRDKDIASESSKSKNLSGKDTNSEKPTEILISNLNIGEFRAFISCPITDSPIICVASWVI